MLNALAKKIWPTTNVDDLVAKLEADIQSADAQALAARAEHTETLLNFHSGKATDASLEKTRRAVERADQKVVELRSSLRGANELRTALAADAQSTADGASVAAQKRAADAILYLVDETDRIAHALSVSISKVVELRGQLVDKRLQVASAMQKDFGGIPDLDGAACRAVNFDSFIKKDFGAMGLAALGPPHTDPSSPRPPTIAERVVGGSQVVRALIAKRVPS